MSVSRVAGPPHFGQVAARKPSRRRELHVVGQQDRQFLLGHRLGAVLGAVHHRDRAAPVALAGDQPVPQAVVDLGVAQPPLHQPGGGGRLGLGDVHPVEKAAVDLAAGPGVHRLRPALRAFGRLDHRQLVDEGEVEVALVFAGDGHDGARPVGAEHVVGEVQRDLGAVERVDGVGAGEDAPLLELALGGLPFHLRSVADPLDEFGHLPLLGGAGRQRRDERVLRGQDDIRHAEDRVDPGGEDADLGVGALDGDVELHALGAADPVALHRLDPLRPVDRVEVVEQLLGVVGDAEHPLLEVAFDHHRAAPVADTALGLLVGQHRLARRAPVDRRHLLVGQAGLVELDEQPLRPPVVVGLAARQLAAPVVGRPQPLDLGLHGGDPLPGDDPGVDPLGDGGVLGREAERVPPHGRQHPEALHRLVAAEDVAEGVVPDVAHVDRPRRIRVHAQVVELRARIALVDLVRAALVPDPLPLGLDGLDVVALAHRRGSLPAPPTSPDAICGQRGPGPGGGAANLGRRTRGHSSVGRALAWHARGRGFKSPRLHRKAPRQRGFSFSSRLVEKPDVARLSVAN